MPVISLPAPLGGLNCRNGVQAYADGDAIRLANLVPRPGFLESRPGTEYVSTDSVTEIYSIYGHPNGTGIIASNGELYSTADLTTTLASGLTGGLWQGVTFGDVVILLDGVNTPRVYNGTTAVTIVATGPTVATLWNGIAFKGRCYYWSSGERRFWYAAAASYQGTLTSFDLSSQTRGDGTLVVAVTMTMDGGNGPDDYIAFIFSDGETLIYQGDDPGSATSWQLVGRFDLPTPRGPQCACNIGSASVVFTDAGPVDLVQVMRTGPADSATVFNNKIGTGPIGVTPYVTEAWTQLLLDPYNKILWAFSYWPTVGERCQQAIGMDTETKAWFGTTEFDGNSTAGARYITCAGMVAGRLFVGDYQGRLSKVGTDVLTDTIGRSGGTAVATGFDMLTTYNAMGNAGVRKQVNSLAFITTRKPERDSFYGDSNVAAPTSITCAAKFNASDVSTLAGTASFGSAPITVGDQAPVSIGDAGYTVAVGLRGTGGGIRIHGINALIKPLGER